MQSWTKYLEAFSRLGVVSVHLKRKGTRLLSSESECTNSLTS